MLSISRDSSGLYRWYAFPAATAYLNRSREIDSVRLFDNFIERIERGAKYPYLTFWHQGPEFKMGQADMIDRDGKCLILSGTWDDTPIARAARSGIESSPKGYWGTSIRYWAYKAENMIILRAGKTIHSPVYTEGELAEVSILPEEVAAGLETQIVTRSIPPATTPSPILLRL